MRTQIPSQSKTPDSKGWLLAFDHPQKFPFSLHSLLLTFFFPPGSLEGAFPHLGAPSGKYLSTQGNNPAKCPRHEVKPWSHEGQLEVCHSLRGSGAVPHG